MSSPTRKGIRWSVADQIMKQGLILLSSAILARLITPEEFGLMGIIMSFLIWFQNLADFGFEASIIQRKSFREGEVSTVFWTNIFFGIVFSLIFYFSAPVIAGFFELPELRDLIRVASLGIIIGAIGIIPNAFIQKQLQFKAFFIRHGISYLIGGAIAIYMALKGYGVWALVAQHLIVSFLNVIISFSLVQWRPELLFYKNYLKDHFKFSLPFMGHSTTNYWIRHLDIILIGKFFNAYSLGIYSRAYNLMTFPVNQIANTVSRVSFPSMSRYQDNRNLIWNSFSNLLASIAAICFPLMAVAGVYAHEIILIIFGGQWEDVVPVFRILCALGAIQSLQAMAYPVYLATGKTKTMFAVSLLTYPFMLIGIIAGLYLGSLEELAAGYLAGGIVAFHIEFYILGKRFKKTLADFYRAFYKEFIASAILLVSLISIKYLIPIKEISLLSMAIHILTGILLLCIYFYLLKIFKSTGFSEIKKLLKK